MSPPRTDAGRRDEHLQSSADSDRSDTAPLAQRAAKPAGRVILAGLVLLGLVHAPAFAQDRAERHVQVAALVGSAQPVGALADYQWDVRPHAAWGARVLAVSGPWSAGVRWWRGGTTQGLGLAGVSDPSVRTNSLELLAHARVARWRNVELAATASGGRLAVSWDPERLTVDTGGGPPVTVTLSTLHEWVAGAGVALALPLGGGWTWGVETERRLFALDTAHRNGSTVSLARETFGDWDARVALTRGWDW